MAVEFARRLKDILDGAMRDSRAELRFALHMLADILVETFDSDLQAINIDDRSGFEVMQIAHSAAHVIDACCLVESSAFSVPAERCFKEFALPLARSYDALSRFLDHDVRDAVEGPVVASRFRGAVPRSPEGRFPAV